MNDLPTGWTLCSLGDLVNRTNQSDPRRVPDREFQYVDVSSVSADDLRIVGSKKYRGADAPTRARKAVREGDVLFATVRPSLRRVARVPLELDGAVCSTAFAVLRPDPALADPAFLFFAVSDPDFVRRVSQHQRGSGYPAIRDGDVLRETLVVPPLAEQRAIARVLRTAERAREATQQVIAAARELKRSLREHLFRHGPSNRLRSEPVHQRETDFGFAPAHWKIHRLDECAHVQTGVAKGRRLRGDRVVEVPYLRVANVQDGYLDLSEVKTIQIEERELRRYSLQSGDVLLTEGGDFDKLGRGYVWQGEVEPCVHQNHIFAVRVDRTRLSPEYLAFLVQSRYGKAYFLKVAHRTTHLASINSTKVKAFPVLLPSMEEQSQIVELLSAVDRKRAVEEERREALDGLFKSLVHNLISGEVRVHELDGELS